MGQGHKCAAFCVAILLLGANVARAVTLGQPLAAALSELRGAGLQLIFSSALIGTALRVNVDPGSGSPEDIARRILAPHGLALNAVHPGLFTVVKQSAETLPAHAAQQPETRKSRPAEPSASLPEVNVYASRYKIEAQQPAASAQFTRDDLDALPGLDEDVLRVARYLPGTASNALSARSHVRGGREDELAVLFDGVPLFEPFHFKDVQSLFGILDPQSISTVDFYSGVFPIRYGNRLSGVLDIRPRGWEGEDYNTLGASFLYTHALSQGRLESHPVEWLASARLGNAGLLARALERDEVEPDFLDALGRLQLNLTDRASLALGGLLLDDGLDIDLGDERAHIDSRDATGWLTWQLRPGEDGRELRVTLSRTERHTLRNGTVERLGSAQGAVDDKRFFDTTTARIEGALNLSDAVRLSGGLEGYDYEARYEYASTLTLDPVLAAAFGHTPALSRAENFTAAGQAYAAYLSTLWHLTARIVLDLGTRWDGQRFGADFSGSQLSPRLSLQFERDPATVMRLSWGRFAQTQRPDELAVQDGDRAFHPTQLGEQLVASVERRASRNTLVRVEAFDKRVNDVAPAHENLLDPATLLPELAVDRVTLNSTRSRAYGAELSLHWQLPPSWQAWSNYSWSQVEDRIGAAYVPRTWNQKHALSTGVAWAHGPWGLSGNAIWHSGWQSNELRLMPDGQVGLAPLNSRSWPDYLSLDLRGTWLRPLPRGALQVFLEINNVTNRNNLCCSEYRSVQSPAELTASREVSGWLPRIYLLGASWRLP
jgi:hypothetical protein